tara:strand:- start:409 stop:831 length:423 start_codon:yes stop_codon:yes gene_type:complete
VYKTSLLIVMFFFIYSCTHKTIYSGKILNQDNFTNINFSNQKNLINNFGYPSYIDPINNKYFYYAQMEEKESAFKKKLNYSVVFVFEFDKDNKIKNSKVYDLNSKDDFSVINEITENEIVQRGLLEKIFGGVGPQQEIPQ